MNAGNGHRAASIGARVIVLLPVAFFLGLGALFYGGLWNKDGSLPSTLIGRPVPEFSLPPIQGRDDGLASAELRGEVSIVNFWASWCVPCRAEMPLLVELAATGTVKIYGVNYKDDAKSALAFLAELGDPYTRIGADNNGRAAIEWGVYGLPETFVIDASGRIAYKKVGPFNRRMLEDDILPVVARLKAEGGGS